jgi:exopolysaccharide biosynthesis polyprenyl glycosylphosphotransferase
VLNRILLVCLDGIALVAALWLGPNLVLLGNPSAMPAGMPSLMSLATPNPMLPSGLALALAWIGSIHAASGYDTDKMTSTPRMLNATIRAGVAVLVFMMALQFARQDATWSRSVILSFAAISTLTVALSRTIFLTIQRHLPQSTTRHKVAIIGAGERAVLVGNRIHNFEHGRWDLAGYITPIAGTDMFSVPPERLIGRVTDLTSLTEKFGLEAVILATPNLNCEEHMVLAVKASQIGVRVLQVPDTWGLANPRLELATVGDMELVDLTSLSYPTHGATLKRALDLLFVIAGGALLSPIFLAVALAIRLSEGKPVVYTQQRSGKGGESFPMYKFRSMVVDAEHQRRDLQPANESDGVLFKIKKDPRVTPLGGWLRKWSIDELPQIVNVLKGEMNLVGPRPLPIADLEGIESNPELMYWFTQRSKVKPGITGSWQVTERGSLKTEDMVRLDIEYIQNWSLTSDLVLLIRTIPALIHGRDSH